MKSSAYVIYRAIKLWCHTAQRGEIHYCSGQFPPKTKTFHSDGKAKLILALHEPRFYLPKNCHFLTHFIRWMKDVSWELGKMSFMRAYTHPISLTLSQSQRKTDFPSFLHFVLLCAPPPHTHTHNIHLNIYSTSISSGVTKRLLFCTLPSLSDIKGASSLTVDSGWASLTSPHCCVKFVHQGCVYHVW